MAKKVKFKKSEKRLLIALAVVALFGGIMLYRIYGPQPTPDPVESESTSEETTSPNSNSSPAPSRRTSRSGGGSRGGGGGGGTRSVDITNIEDHSNPNDCWVAIDGKAYDITPFIQSYQSTDKNVSNFCGTYGFEEGFLKENSSLEQRVLRESSQVGVL